MKHVLSAKEARVIGCLMEKQVTTPELYPLSLNSLTTACNQKTNREPVMELSESEVQQTLDLLAKKHMIRSVSGSRTLKYEHRFCNSEFGNLKFSPGEFAVVTALLLRGAQTSGELRTRTNRLHDFASVADTDDVLNTLIRREDGPFVVRLAREPGKRESRFMHLFCGEVSEQIAQEQFSASEGQRSSTEGQRSSIEDQRQPAERSGLESRVTALEEQVAELNQRLESLLAHLGD